VAPAAEFTKTYVAAPAHSTDDVPDIGHRSGAESSQEDGGDEGQPGRHLPSRLLPPPCDRSGAAIARLVAEEL